MTATSPYLKKPARNTRAAEIDKLVAELKDCERVLNTDGNLESVRLLLEMAQKCAQAHYDNLPLEDRLREASWHSSNLVIRIRDLIEESYEPARKEYADYLAWLEEQQQIAGLR